MLSDTPTIQRAILCPSCKTLWLDYGTGIPTCPNCGHILEVATKKTETFPTGSGTTQPQAIVEAEETKRSARFVLLQHTHDVTDIPQLDQDLKGIKKDIADMKKVLLATKPSVEVRVVKTKEITLEEAKPLVEKFLEEFLKTHEEVYPSDVADELELEYGLAKKIFDELEKEGKIKKKVE